MNELALALPRPSHLPILLVVGTAVVFGTIGARLFQRLGIPQVVAYICLGLLVGPMALGLIGPRTIRQLQPFSFFALGVIGFMIGGELRLDLLRKYGKTFLAILLGEGLGAFVLVGALVTSTCWLLTGDARLSLALGTVLGAISSATAPAATVDVLWEYKTRGILTTTVFAIVAMDDGLALLLYALAASAAGVLLGTAGGGGWLLLMGHVAYELAGAVLLGAAAGMAVNVALRHPCDHQKALPFMIGSLALLIGLARMLDVDLILATMSFGAVLVNLAPRRSRAAFEVMEDVAPPIYVLFFVMVGARLHIAGMAGWMWALAGSYLIGRTAGKMLGAHLGARWSGAAQSVRKYLGLCLFSQAGVAIGLSILAADRFSGDMGLAIMMIVTATTFVVQIIGPPCVKLAVKRAGEVGLKVTERDLMESYTVGQMVDSSIPAINLRSPLAEVVRIVGQTDATSYPVVSETGELMGVITLEGLRRSFMDEELTKVLVAYDLMESPPDAVTEGVPLAEGMSKMHEQHLTYLPVVSAKDGRLIGLLDERTVKRRLSEEVIRRQRLAAAQVGPEAQHEPATQPAGPPKS